MHKKFLCCILAPITHDLDHSRLIIWERWRFRSALMSITFLSTRLNQKKCIFQMKAHIILIKNLKFTFKLLVVSDLDRKYEGFGYTVPINNFLSICIITSSPKLHTASWELTRSYLRMKPHNALQRSRLISWKWTEPPLTEQLYTHEICIPSAQLSFKVLSHTSCKDVMSQSDPLR